IGIATRMENVSILADSGLDFITLSTSDFLMPDKGDEAFAERLAEVKKHQPPVLAVNSFIRPKHLKCVGPEANHDEVMEWAETVFRRAQQAGVRFVVFGSNGTRRVPENWPLEKAREQFVEVLKRMGPVAEKHGVIVALEQLRPAECNFLNHIRDGAEIIRKVAHPNVRLLADLYHMKQSGDTPEDLRAAMDVVVHVEIAEFEKRTIPGTADSDFRPFFRVLREAGYSGLVNIEAGGWKIGQIPAAIAVIREQEAAVGDFNE
ncbi:MAG TPA: sugar phosphate isomerase/epimerase family protein, partial [Luteolibacter sp.]|nr:sugar phosphate isomerase/epimerase family protein [Luteolibacter sp.]